MRETARTRANRRNAQRSTGPKTSQGKRRASQNARRHGLSSAFPDAPSNDKEVEALTRFVAGPHADLSRMNAAREVALATVELDRIRRLRRHYLVWGWPLTARELKQNTRELLSIVHGLTAIAAYANAPTLESKRELDPFTLVRVIETLLTWGAPAQSASLSESSPIRRCIHRRVIALERYERRAIGRRRRAIREYDAFIKNRQVALEEEGRG